MSQGLFCGREISLESSIVRDTANYVKQLSEKYNTSTEAIVLAWLLCHPVAMQPVIGSTNIQRIEACTQGVSIILTREEWYQLYILVRGAELP